MLHTHTSLDILDLGAFSSLAQQPTPSSFPSRLQNPTMAPRKRQQSETSPAPPRKSARLAARPTSPTREQARGLSVMTTDTESSETWPSLAEAAKARIAKYQPQNRVHEERLQPSLNAFVEWLPEGGRESVARDIINATTDEDLYNVFHNLLTGLAVPSKSRARV
jgi:hypothetical protein